MSEEGDRFWVTLSEKVVGIVLIIIGALLLYFTWDTSKLGGVSWIFAVLGVVVLVVGILMMISKSSE